MVVGKGGGKGGREGDAASVGGGTRMTVTEGGRQGDEGGQKYGAEWRQEEGAQKKKRRDDGEAARTERENREGK